jgi:hypothetical protein
MRVFEEISVTTAQQHRSCPTPNWRGLLSCGVTDQGEPGGGGGTDSRQKGRMRMEGEYRASRDGGLLSCWKGKKKGKKQATDDARALHPAKAAAGPCTRLARYGGPRFPNAGLPSGQRSVSVG